MTQDLSRVESHPPTLLLKASTQYLYCSLSSLQTHKPNLLLLLKHGAHFRNAGFTGMCCVHPVVNSLQHFGFSYVIYILSRLSFSLQMQLKLCVGVCVPLEAEAAMPLWSIWSLSEALPGLSPISACLFPSLALNASQGRREERGREGNAVCLFVSLLLFYSGFFADHSSDWPRNVAVLYRAEWTPDSAMEATVLFFFCERDEWGTQGLWWNEMTNTVPL